MSTAQPDPCSGPVHPRALEGIWRFNAGSYWEAHEALEDAWRASPDPIRKLYQGILQVAVVCFHIERRNYVGALKVYERSQKWLAGWPDVCRGVQIGQMKADYERLVAEVRRLGPDHIGEISSQFFKPIIVNQKEEHHHDHEQAA
jgi:hypothetical protein